MANTPTTTDTPINVFHVYARIITNPTKTEVILEMQGKAGAYVAHPIQGDPEPTDGGRDYYKNVRITDLIPDADSLVIIPKVHKIVRNLVGEFARAYLRIERGLWETNNGVQTKSHIAGEWSVFDCEVVGLSVNPSEKERDKYSSQSRTYIPVADQAITYLAFHASGKAHEVNDKLALDKLSSTNVKSTTPHTQGEANEWK